MSVHVAWSPASGRQAEGRLARPLPDDAREGIVAIGTRACVHADVSTGDHPRHHPRRRARQQSAEPAVLAANRDVVRVADLVADLSADDRAGGPADQAQADGVECLPGAVHGRADLGRGDRRALRIHAGRRRLDRNAAARQGGQEQRRGRAASGGRVFQWRVHARNLPKSRDLSVP